MHRNAQGGRVDFFLTYRVNDEKPENREPAKCSELVWANQSSLPDDLIPYVRAAIEHTHRGGFRREPSSSAASSTLARSDPGRARLAARTPAE